MSLAVEKTIGEERSKSCGEHRPAMAELKWIIRAVAALFFAFSFAFLVAAYADWRWPKSIAPMHGDSEVDVALAIVFFLTGVLVIVYGRWKRRQEDALEK